MSQTWNAGQYVNHASFVAQHGLPVLDLLGPKSGERILDLGCGDGALTADIAKSGAVVHGVDASPSMVAAARERGLSAEVMSGDQLDFHSQFDAVFSNAALHWMTNADSVLAGVHRVLKPGGRFVGEFGGEGNVAVLVNAMRAVFDRHPGYGEFHNPWYFPSVEDYGQKLQRAGFQVHYIERIPRPTPLNTGVRTWLEIFSNGITRHIPKNRLDEFLDEVETLVRPHLYVDDQWVADYVRLRFVAHKA